MKTRQTNTRCERMSIKQVPRLAKAGHSNGDARLLLRNTVQCSRAINEVRAVDSDDFPLRKNTFKYLQGCVIGFDLKGWNQHDLISNVEIHIARGQPPPGSPDAIVSRGWHRDLHDFEFRPPQDVVVFFERGVIGI